MFPCVKRGLTSFVLCSHTAHQSQGQRTTITCQTPPWSSGVRGAKKAAYNLSSVESLHLYSCMTPPHLSDATCRQCVCGVCVCVCVCGGQTERAAKVKLFTFKKKTTTQSSNAALFLSHVHCKLDWRLTNKWATAKPGVTLHNVAVST